MAEGCDKLTSVSQSFREEFMGMDGRFGMIWDCGSMLLLTIDLANLRTWLESPAHPPRDDHEMHLAEHCRT